MATARADATRFPIVDLHCDLLSYLANTDDASPFDTADIGCAVPFLEEGYVKVQVLAAYVPTDPRSTELAMNELRLFEQLPTEYSREFHHVSSRNSAVEALESDGTGVIAAIENASALCSEVEPLDAAFGRLEQMVESAGRVCYITLTHHGANRFGGGNMTDIGLSEDGRCLLDFLDGLNIAIDMSHTSDALARGILDHVDMRGLSVPILASHSNFRSVFDHARNLPDWLAREIVDRGGVIGINFVRAFVHESDPAHLEKHVLFGYENGLGDGLCFGADFFYWKGSLDQGRIPFYHPEHENAGRYQRILDSFGPDLGVQEKRALANGNAIEFLSRLWG